MITGPNLYSRKLKGFNTSRKMHFRTRFKNTFWDKISLPCDTLSLVNLRELNMQTGSQTEDIIYPPVIPNNTMDIQESVHLMLLTIIQRRH